MSFTYPLGLLGLIGIPIIIIIYILQSKYTEQTVSSTYLWELSNRFLKRKNPLSGITGIISIILQMLAVVVISLLIARPVFVLPDAANDYCFILDTSGSMSTEEGRRTRFERAKDEISDVIRSSSDGSSYSVICVSGDSYTAFEGVTSKNTAIELLDGIDVTNTSCDYSEMLAAAQAEFDENTSAFIYLVTDKSYTTHENIEIIDVGTDNLDNFAIFNAEYSHSGATLSVTADVISYVSDAAVEVVLYIDGERSAVQSVSASAGELTSVSFGEYCLNFSSFTLEVTNSDGYSVDNSVTTHNLKSDKSYKTLIVSETGFFLQAVIDALVDSEVETVTPDEYSDVDEKYGLYIFDCCVPEELPDGAVWLINADENIENSGFSVRGKIELSQPDTIEKSKASSTAVRNLLSGVDGDDISISHYVKYSGMYLNFSTLFTYDSNPVIFAGANGLGNRQVVFGFDLHQSDFALSYDFVMLLGNLLEYSFPDVIDDSNYTVGEEALINILPNAENYKAQSPSGKDIYIDSSSATASLALDEVGTYTVTVTLAGVEIPYNIYSAAHPDESEPVGVEDDFSLSGERTYESRDGQYDPTVLLFICLAVLFVADWGLYCYEKYQLR